MGEAEMESLQGHWDYMKIQRVTRRWCPSVKQPYLWKHMLLRKSAKKIKTAFARRCSLQRVRLEKPELTYMSNDSRLTKHGGSHRRQKLMSTPRGPTEKG